MKLKEARQHMSLTQEDMARLLGVTLRTYQNIERRKDCTVKVAKNIAIILGRPIEELFEE